MSKVENTKIKKVTLWASVVVVLFSLLLSPLAIAATTTVKVDNVKSQIEAAAKVHLIAQKFQRCIGYGDSSNGSITTPISADSAKSGNFYSGTTNIPTGSYLEDLINGDDGDKNGEIWCKNDRNTNITKLFADAIGVSVSNIVCNKNDPYYGGLFAPATANYSYGGGVSYELEENKNCSNATNYKYNTHDATTLASGKTITSGKTYIKELYDEYKAKSGNPYLLDFDSLGTYDKIDGYYLYLNDFRTACSNKVFKEEYEGQLAHDDLYFTIFTVNDKGEIGTIYYDRNGKNDSSSSRSSFVSGGPTTCGALVNKINEYSSIYQDEIKKEIKNQCKSALSGVIDDKIAEVQEIIDNEESSENAKKTAQEKLDEYNKIKNSGQYTTDTEDGGLVCVDVPDVKIEVDTPEPGPLDPSNPAATEGDPCYNAGVDGMSWILCPAINNMAGAVDGIDKLLREWLSIDSSWMNTSSGTYTAWGYCRDIANLLLIVVLIAVIISQVTGYGIDNYGIKKILPRLIAIAILVNLSFIICQLLADLSNILGTSLDKLFQSVGRTISGVTAGQVVSTIIAAIFGVIAGAGAAAGTVITIIGLVEGGGGVMLVISLVLVLLIALVAVMMFFLMLGARMIIIIIFSALSPIAFACFVLPNTQKWFKKWWDIYKAALVMYPICGALYGISYVIRGIVFSGEGVHLWMALIAVCAPFIPFLILPTLLKGALSALGAVGNSIMSLGNGLKKGISKGNDTLRNTAAYQQAQEFNRNKLAEKRANRTISRLGSIESSGGRLTNSQRNRLYKARMTANETMMRNETEKAGVTMIDQSTAAMRAKATRQAQETKLWSDQFARADSKTIETAFIDALRSGKSEDVAKASAAFSALKDTGNLPKIHSALTSANWANMSNDMRLALNQDMIKSGDVAMKTYAKRSFAADNQGSFAEFMAGRTQTLNTSSGTRTIGGVGEELAKIGSHALDGQDKDSVEFLANHMDGLINNAASNPETRGSIAKMIMSGATSTQSGEEKKRFAEMIEKYKASFGGNQAAYEKAISEAVSAAQLAKLDSSIYGALGTTDEVNRMLSGAIAEIKKDNNATLYAGMSNAVKEAINKPAAPPIPPTPPTPPAP